MTPRQILILELANAFRAANDDQWEQAEKVNRVITTLFADDDSPNEAGKWIRDALAKPSSIGLNIPPVRVSPKKLTFLHDAHAWRVSRDLELDYIRDKGITVSDANLLKRIPPEHTQEWIDKLLTLPPEEFNKQLRQAEGKPERQFVMLKVDRGAGELYASARDHMSTAVGVKLSDSTFVGFLGHLINESDPGELRALWEREHGGSN